MERGAARFVCRGCFDYIKLIHVKPFKTLRELILYNCENNAYGASFDINQTGGAGFQSKHFFIRLPLLTATVFFFRLLSRYAGHRDKLPRTLYVRCTFVVRSSSTRLAFVAYLEAYCWQQCVR